MGLVATAWLVAAKEVTRGFIRLERVPLFDLGAAAIPQHVMANVRRQGAARRAVARGREGRLRNNYPPLRIRGGERDQSETVAKLRPAQKQGQETRPSQKQGLNKALSELGTRAARSGKH